MRVSVLLCYNPEFLRVSTVISFPRMLFYGSFRSFSWQTLDFSYSFCSCCNSRSSSSSMVLISNRSLVFLISSGMNSVFSILLSVFPSCFGLHRGYFTAWVPWRFLLLLALGLYASQLHTITCHLVGIMSSFDLSHVSLKNTTLCHDDDVISLQTPCGKVIFQQNLRQVRRIYHPHHLAN